ncbi:MAG: dockerin type I repeat-containing protein, partial [Planctomycetota bacterium]
DGSLEDSYVCVVAGSRFAILEGGHPEFRGIYDVRCEQSGSRAELTWRSGQIYDSIEILRDCQVIDVLPGHAASWQREFRSDGIYDVSVRAISGRYASSGPECRIVVGPGETIRSVDLGTTASFLGDIASDGVDVLMYVRQYLYTVRFFDIDLEPLGEVPIDPEFVVPGQAITGVAYGGESDTLYLYNQENRTIGKMTFDGELLGVAHAELPPRGLGYGLSFRDAGLGGRGTVLLQYWSFSPRSVGVFEFDTEGRKLRSIRHPYDRWDPPIPGCDHRGARVRGVAVTDQDELYLLGQAWSQPEEAQIFRMSLDRHEVIRGSEVPVPAGVYLYQSHEFVSKGGSPRLFVLGGAPNGNAHIFETRIADAEVARPTRLLATQLVREDQVDLSFQNNGPYDRVEVFRDCEKIAEVGGRATSYRDEDVEPGVHQYTVRGVVGEKASAKAEASLRVGIGAVLQREHSCTIALWEISPDPTDGSFFVSSHPFDDPLKIDHYDANLNFLDSRDAAIGFGYELRTLAVRVRADGERLLYTIVRRGARLFLASETMDGELLDLVLITSEGKPHGLNWEPISDTFFYHEREADVIVRISVDGERLERFRNPAAPISHIAEDFGLALSPERRSLLMLSAALGDPTITQVVEVDFSGRRTGYEIAIPESETGVRVRGLAAAGDDLIAVGSYSMLRLKAFESTPFRDDGEFRRGDVNDDRFVDVSDAIAGLRHLFLGEVELRCEDSADVDDDGRLNVSDPIYLLAYLFRGGPAPLDPFEIRDVDPSADRLACGPE